MKLREMIRLFRKHLVLILLVPIIVAGIIIASTLHPRFVYRSQTVLYTGIATGSGVEMDKSFNYFAANTAFDNLINVIQSRQTQQEVAIRLLSLHLMMKKPDPKYICLTSFAEIKKITPPYILDHIGNPAWDTGRSDLHATSESLNIFPAYLDRTSYEHTVRNLTRIMSADDTNFIYKLLNYEHPHYSIKAISTAIATRMANSDLIKLSYEADDPGICQQTLALYNEVCIRNYRFIKDDRSDAVVKYFEDQLALAASKLRNSEDRLLQFNKQNNIINYYEQSKAVAVVKEDLIVDYNDKKAQLSGLQASIRRLEEKLGIQQQVHLKSSDVVEKKNTLGELNYQIASMELQNERLAKGPAQLDILKEKAESLKHEIRKSVDELYTYGNSTDGLPIRKILDEWINNVVESEHMNARLKVMDGQIRDFQEQYAVYAPAGAHIKRIEREISVSEQEFLEILHGLNLAKLKMQDNAFATSIKTIDPPYYPLSPKPAKRKFLVMGGALFGGLLVLGSILTTEYFDRTLKHPARATAQLGIPFIGMLPRICISHKKTDSSSLRDRLLSNIIQHIDLATRHAGVVATPRTVIFTSTLAWEGKTVIAGNLARKMTEMGRKVVYADCSSYEIGHDKKSSTDATPSPRIQTTSVPVIPVRKFPFLRKILGYPDPRIDKESTLLRDPGTYLPDEAYLRCDPDMNIHDVENAKELLERCNKYIPADTEWIFIELPPLLQSPFPIGLVEEAQLTILVCRSNRTWTVADDAAMEMVKSVAGQRMRFMLNGVEEQETEFFEEEPAAANPK
jgi:uncharacterized protein involved in exopolysaccharide biosynthesis